MQYPERYKSGTNRIPFWYRSPMGMVTRRAMLRQLEPDLTADQVSWLLARPGVESADRPYIFLDLHRDFVAAHGLDVARAASVFWRSVAFSWVGFDAISRDVYGRVFCRWREYWSADCMAPENRAAFEELPSGRLQIFRGQDCCSAVGVSWTLDKTMAENFAPGHRGIRNPRPVVLEAEVARDDVAFVATGLGEAEVVLFASPDGWYPV